MCWCWKCCPAEPEPLATFDVCHQSGLKPEKKGVEKFCLFVGKNRINIYFWRINAVQLWGKCNQRLYVATMTPPTGFGLLESEITTFG